MSKKEFAIFWTIGILGLAFWVMGLFLNLKPIGHFACGMFTILTLIGMGKAYIFARF